MKFILYKKPLDSLRPIARNAFWNTTVILWLAGTCVAMSSDRLETKTLVAPRKNFPPLALQTTIPLDITTDDPDSDFIVYYVTERGADKKNPPARMTVYEGQSPQALSHYVDNQSFFQVPTSFASERSCWFTWISKETDGEKLHAVAYLYNTVQSTAHGHQINYVLQIEISGTGTEFKQLQEIAKTIQPKK